MSRLIPANEYTCDVCGAVEKCHGSIPEAWRTVSTEYFNWRGKLTDSDEYDVCFGCHRGNTHGPSQEKSKHKNIFQTFWKKCRGISSNLEPKGE